MADNEQVKWVLDLDITEFSENALKAQGLVKEVGNPENLSGLVETLGNSALVLGAAATAAYAFKTAIDLSEEAETLKRVEDEFRTLSAQAGISSRELEEGLEKASAGLVSTNDLFGTVNQSIIKMGASAAKLPEIMEIARKATAVFGGDLQTNFNNITTAISNGNARMLKQYGIVIDTTKAVKQFADANGIAANEVSEAGRQQAILNAALEQGQTRFQNVSGDMGETTTLVQKFKVSLSELKEMFILVFDKTIGPSLHNFLNVVNDITNKARVSLTSMFGDGLKQNQAQITLTEEKLNSLKGTLIDLEQIKGTSRDLVPADTLSRIQSITVEIKKYEGVLSDLKAQNAELIAQDEKSEKSKTALLSKSQESAQQDIINQTARLANEAKFQEQVAAADRAFYAEKQKNIQSLTDLEQIVSNTSIALAQDHAAKLGQISRNETLNERQKNQLSQIENNRYTEAIKNNERSLAQLRVSLMNQYLVNSRSVYQGIQLAAQQMTMQAKLELQDFGMQGKEILGSFKENAVSAFQTMGKSMAEGTNIAQATTEAIKQLFLGMIGDIAIQDGTRIMLSGVWPPNPAAFAAGAALIAFGGAIKSLAGGAATTTSTGAVSTSATQVSASNNGVTTTKAANDTSNLSSMQTTPQRVVNVNIAGNYFDTSTTRLQLMEMIRQETNATDFRYDTIGV